MRTVLSKWADQLDRGCVHSWPAHDMTSESGVSISELVNKSQLSASDPEPGFHCLPAGCSDRKEKSECATSKKSKSEREKLKSKMLGSV